MSAAPPVCTALPLLSPALLAHLAVLRPGGFAPPATLEAEARAALPAYTRALAPLPEAELAAMVEELAEMLNAGVVNPLPGVALQLRCVALVAACATVPALAWTAGAVRHALAAFTFFPSAAQLVALLEEQCGMARVTHSRLRLLVTEAEQRVLRAQAQERRWAAWEQQQALQPVYNPVDNVDCMKNQP